MNAELRAEDLERFRAIIAQHFGLAFDAGRLDQLAELLGERTAATGARSAADYLDSLAGGHGAASELKKLTARLTVGETYFFRNPAHFAAFTDTVLPDRLAARADRRTLRILSAGCATGEEAYSLAIVVNERRQQLAGWQFKIDAIDVNPAAIKQAVRAVYPRWSLRATSADLSGRYFRIKDRDCILEPSVREMVTFQERNLVGAAGDDAAFWAEGAFDVIFFRNVVMYFSIAAARTVMERLARALAPGGYLFLGDAETLRELSDDFSLRHTNGTFYYQRIEGAEKIDRRQPDRFESCGADHMELPAVSSAAELFADIDSASQRISRAVLEATEKAAANGHAIHRNGDRETGPARSWDIESVFDLMRQERFDDSIQSLKALPPHAREDPDVQLLQAVLLTNCGNLIQAEEVCAQLLRGNEFNAGGHYLTALCREHRGDCDGAIHHDQVAIYLAPPFAMAHFHLGLMAKRARDFALAKHEFARASILFGCEDPSRILLFGGGFSRDALVRMCRTELHGCGGGS